MGEHWCVLPLVLQGRLGGAGRLAECRAESVFYSPGLAFPCTFSSLRLNFGSDTLFLPQHHSGCSLTLEHHHAPFPFSLTPGGSSLKAQRWAHNIGRAFLAILTPLRMVSPSPVPSALAVGGRMVLYSVCCGTAQIGLPLQLQLGAG